jgi:uncharacterized membrane protein
MPWRRPYRFLRHLATDHGSARRAFPAAALAEIEALIADGERRHRGQVRFVCEASLPLGRVLHKLSPRERALELFGLLRIWDTEENCGVLIYALLADRDVEVVADRGIHAKVGAAAWESICRRIEAAFRVGRYADGAAAGIREVNELLAQHYPRGAAPVSNELPDRPLVM